LCLPPDCLDSEPIVTDWWLLSIAGKEGLLGPGPLPGPVRDSRTADGRLRCGDYELLQQPKTFRDKSEKVKTVTTWTWRIQPMRYREWAALLVERARVRDSQGVATAFDALRAMPMFAGIRAQVIALARETNKVLAKVGMASFVLPELPIVRMIQLWSDAGEL
jgi:L-2-hydroxyglutarate oxidase LhgO